MNIKTHLQKNKINEQTIQKQTCRCREHRSVFRGERGEHEMNGSSYQLYGDG